MKSIMPFLFLTCSSIFSFAQGTWTTDFGLSIPTGSFSWDSGADLGFTIGLNYFIPISNQKFKILTSVDFVYNGITTEKKEDVLSEQEYRYAIATNSGTTINMIGFPNYFNLPLFAGISYPLNNSTNNQILGNVGLVINIFKQKDTSYQYPNDAIAYRSVSAHVSIGFRFGGSISVSENFLIGADFFSNFSDQYLSEWSYGDVTRGSDNIWLKVSYITLTGHYRIFKNKGN